MYEQFVKSWEKFWNFVLDFEYEPWVGDRLGAFWYNQLSERKYRLLWKVAKTLLLLSHGQASVERGFSVNKEIMIDNMHDITLVALRHNCSHVTFVWGIGYVEMTKPLVLNASLSCQRYQAHLEEVKKKKL